MAKLPPEVQEGFTEVAVLQTPELWKRIEAEIMPGMTVADQAFLNQLFMHGNEFSFHVDAPSKPFDKPTLFLVGRQDHWVGYQDAWNIVETYPRATFAVLDRAGHCLQMEQESLFNALVHEWLDRVEEQSQ